MSVRRRIRAARRPPRGFSGWICDGRGPDMHLTADQAPSQKSLEALFELRDAVLALCRQAELEAGRWEDDGGAPGPERGRVTSLITPPRGRRP